MSTPPTFMVLAGGSTVPAFSPTDVTGLALWIDLSDPTTLYTDLGTTLVSADGQTIAQANDKSGNARHLTQSTAGSRPTYKTGIVGGRAIGRFAGSHFLTRALSGISSSAAFAQWIVMKPAATGVVSKYVFDPFDGNSQALIYGFEASMLESYQNPRVNVGLYDGSSFGVYEVVDDNTNRTGRLNGIQTEQVAATTGGDVATGTIALGATNAGASGVSADIAAFIYVVGSVPAGQVTSMRAYLGARYGIAVS